MENIGLPFEPNESSGTMLPVCDLDGGIPDGCLCVKAEENVETAELDMQLKTGKVDFEKLNEKLGQVFRFELKRSLGTICTNDSKSVGN